MSSNPGSTPNDENLSRATKGLAIWLSPGAFLMLLYALSFIVATPDRTGVTKALAFLSNSVLLATAFSALGGLLGFLFGVPRTLQQEAPSTNPPSATGSGSAASPISYQLRVNTNVEQISDWLTKIIVGVGLTQLTRFPQKLAELGEYLKLGFDGSAIFPSMLVLYFSVYGFFAGYLLTRLFLATAFSEADQAAAKLRNVVQVASMLSEAKDYNVAAVTLEKGLAQLRADTPKETKRQVYEQLTYNFLYQDPPVGFQKVIEYGNRYVEEEPSTPSARIWVYLASAYGQQYKWEADHGSDPSVLEASKKAALNATKNALSLEPKMKALLRMLWDPKDATKVSKEEDDLEVFYSDPGFQKLLGE